MGYHAYAIARVYFIPSSARFRPPLVKDVIHLVLKETLHEKQYSSEEAKTLTKEISDIIQTKLKGIFMYHGCVPMVVNICTWCV